jgi:hypothetical protein
MHFDKERQRRPDKEGALAIDLDYQSSEKGEGEEASIQSPV